MAIILLIESKPLKAESITSGEYDGAPISKFTPDGFPEIDNTILNFHRIESIGFDKEARGGKETIGTFIVFQKNANIRNYRKRCFVQLVLASGPRWARW